MKRRYRFIHFFLHDMKFKHKFMLTHLFLVLVPTLFVLVFVYGRLSHIITTNTIASEQALVSQTASTLEATVNQIEMAMDTILSGPLLSKASFGEEFYASLSREPEQTEAKELYGYINAVLEQNFITAIRIYLPEGREDIAGSYDFPDPGGFLRQHYRKLLAWHF